MMEFTTELYACIDAFERKVSTQFINIEAHDLGGIWEEVSIL